MLTPEQAQKELCRAAQMNPGLWEQHSISVANNARLIAAHVPQMDTDKAYIMGLMHDIGRREGVTGIRHIFDGYNYMMSMEEPELARICLTHSFPTKNAKTFSGQYDCSQDQMDFLQIYLTQSEYDDYDRLIQLCDAISLLNGACIMEKRLIDVTLRHGFSEFTLEKWKAFMRAKAHFDSLCRCNVYTLLPNVFENSCVDLL